MIVDEWLKEEVADGAYVDSLVGGEDNSAEGFHVKRNDGKNKSELVGAVDDTMVGFLERLAEGL